EGEEALTVLVARHPDRVGEVVELFGQVLEPGREIGDPLVKAHDGFLSGRRRGRGRRGGRAVRMARGKDPKEIQTREMRLGLAKLSLERVVRRVAGRDPVLERREDDAREEVVFAMEDEGLGELAAAHLEAPKDLHLAFFQMELLADDLVATAVP